MTQRSLDRLSSSPGLRVAAATVVRASAGARVRVRFDDGATRDALSTIGQALRPGDRLVVTEGDDGCFALGVLSALREVPDSLVLDDGSRAERDADGLVVRDAEGRLLFEHRPAEGKSVVHAPHGDLELSAPGALRLSADRLELGARRVELRGEDRGGASALRLDGRGATLEATALEAQLEAARVVVAEGTVAAGSLTIAAERVQTVATRIERVAERLLDRAKDVYVEAEELAQVRAGRVRHVAARALRMFGQSAEIGAEEDVVVRADKIHLG